MPDCQVAVYKQENLILKQQSDCPHSTLEYQVVQAVFKAEENLILKQQSDCPHSTLEYQVLQAVFKVDRGSWVFL